MGQTSGSYNTSFNAGNTTSYTISNLTDGATYYFAARAYDGSGSQSAPSNEVAVTLPAIPPTPTPPPPTVSYVITADFTVKNTTGRAPLAVAFTSTSTGTIASYSWNFGDGTTSTARGPSHTYAAAGTYSVSLQVIAPDGSQAGTTKPNLITVRPGTVTWKRSRR
jgi:PKD repeat protein